MAKNTEHVQHVKSRLADIIGGKRYPHLPNPSALTEGEIAINFAKDVETLSIKNESGDVVTFSSDNYYSEQKLGSAFTGANSAVTVTDYINGLDMGNEVEVNSGDTPTGETIELWVDESVDPAVVDVYTKTEVDTLLEGKLDEGVFESYSGTVIEQIGERALQGDLEALSSVTTGHTANTDIHVTTSDKTAWDAKLDDSDVDQVIDSTTSASTMPVATKAVYDVVEQIKQDFDGDLDDLSDKLDEHSGNTVMHITSAERTAWNAKVDASDLAIYADAVKYNSTTHYVEFYNGTTAGTKVFGYDASPFLIDGMVDNVEITDISGTTYLVVSFNTDAGKQDIEIPVSEIFDADEYYTKDEIDESDEIVAAALNDLEERKMDASGMTNYYTKSETSGANEIADAVLGLSHDISDVDAKLNTHSADTTLHFTTEQKRIFIDLTKYAEYYSGITSADTTNWDNKQDQLVSGTNIKTINSESLLGSGDILIDVPDELWVSGTGLNSVVLKGSSGTASGDYSVAEGYQTSATSQASHAEGTGTTASGNYSHAEGNGTKASGSSSHAEGSYTTANGSQSHAEGLGSFANGAGSHAEGNGGSGAYGDGSHAEGAGTRAYGTYSHAEGLGTATSGNSSHAEGSNTIASGDYSHAEGNSTSATSYVSHAEGELTLASGVNSHAEGDGTVASGLCSHAEGYSTSATSIDSHAEGASTLASGNYSHAEGSYTKASGEYSHAEGRYTIANNISEHASGWYNVSNSATTTFGDSGNTLFSVGNGTADNARHNAFEIRQNGDIYIVDKNGQDVRLQDEIGNITIDQVIDSGTSASTNAVSTSAVYGFVTSYTPSITVDQDFSNTASTNPISTKAVYSAITENELVWTNTYVTISGAISSHTEDTSIHLTSTEKGQLHTHSNKSALDAITGNVGTMAYENTSSYSSATEVNTALSHKANASHNQGANTITAMTNYTSGSTNTPIQTSDTLNQAIGKLEHSLGGMKLVKVTQAEYDALVTKDSNTLYVIVN